MGNSKNPFHLSVKNTGIHLVPWFKFQNISDNFFKDTFVNEETRTSASCLICIALSKSSIYL